MKPRQHLARVLACMSASRTTQHVSTCACMRMLQCDWRSRKRRRGIASSQCELLVGRRSSQSLVEVERDHLPPAMSYVVRHLACCIAHVAARRRAEGDPVSGSSVSPPSGRARTTRTHKRMRTHPQTETTHTRAQRQTHTPCMHGSHTAHRLLRAIDKRPDLRERAELIENMHLPRRRRICPDVSGCPCKRVFRPRRECVRACVRAWGRGCVKGGAGQGWGASECRLLCAFSHSSSRLSRIASLSRALMAEAACRTSYPPSRTDDHSNTSPKVPSCARYKSMHVPAAHRAHHPRRQPRVQRCTARSNSVRRGVSRSGRPHWRGARLAWEAGTYWRQASQPGEPPLPSSPRPSAVRPWPMIGGGGNLHRRAMERQQERLRCCALREERTERAASWSRQPQAGRRIRGDGGRESAAHRCCRARPAVRFGPSNLDCTPMGTHVRARTEGTAALGLMPG